jgi:hypothetical protein
MHPDIQRAHRSGNQFDTKRAKRGESVLSCTSTSDGDRRLTRAQTLHTLSHPGSLFKMQDFAPASRVTDDQMGTFGIILMLLYRKIAYHIPGTKDGCAPLPAGGPRSVSPAAHPRDFCSLAFRHPRLSDLRSKNYGRNGPASARIAARLGARGAERL